MANMSYPELLKLKQLESKDLIPTTEETECSGCYVSLAIGTGVVLRDCLHVFCKLCLRYAVTTADGLVVKCPYRDIDYACSLTLQEREIRALVTEEFNQYLARAVNIGESDSLKNYHCQSPNCPGWWLYDENENITSFYCPVCKKSNCCRCGTIHDGTDCESHQRALAMAAGGSEWAQFMAQKDESYCRMLDMEEKQDLIPSIEDFVCLICSTLIRCGEGEGVRLRECLHNFCRECLVGLVRHGDGVTVKCPYVDDNYSCTCEISEREIKALVPPDVLEKYLARSLTQAEAQMKNSFHCKTPDCTGWCEVEDAVNDFPCQVCHKTNCITCAAVHEGKNCKEYQVALEIASETDENARKSREMMQQMIVKGDAMHCPGCNVIIQKKAGCDSILCSYCKIEICWVTRGPRWGKKGRGDTTGGCKCMVNGKRCHPKCGNCH